MAVFDMLQEIEIIDSNAESVGKKRAAQVAGDRWRVGKREREREYTERERGDRESGQTEPN